MELECKWMGEERQCGGRLPEFRMTNGTGDTNSYLVFSGGSRNLVGMKLLRRGLGLAGIGLCIAAAAVGIWERSREPHFTQMHADFTHTHPQLLLFFGVVLLLLWLDLRTRPPKGRG